MFWKKKRQIVSEEYADLLNKFSQIAQEFATIKAQFDALNTNMNSLRGIVNRKIAGGKSLDDDDVTKEIEDLKRFLQPQGYYTG